jgi:hypothetical protein
MKKLDRLFVKKQMHLTRHISLKLMSLLMILGCTPLIGRPQTQSRENMDWERQQRQRQREEREAEKRSKNLRELGDLRGKSTPRPIPVPPYVSPSELTAEQKSLLEPSLHYEASFAKFLSQPNTGLVRLLPREKYDQTFQMPLRGGGAYYSFNKLSQEQTPWSDIKFQEGELHTGVNDLTLGLMTMLGDVSLENVDLDNPAVKFISQLALPVKYGEYKSHLEKYRLGFGADGTYRSGLPAQLNTTYVMRSTIYNRVDSVVGFRVIGEDADGSVTLLWKLLNKLPVKKLKDIPRQ